LTGREAGRYASLVLFVSWFRPVPSRAPREDDLNDEIGSRLCLVAGRGHRHRPAPNVNEIISPRPYGLHAKALNNNGQGVGSATAEYRIQNVSPWEPRRINNRGDMVGTVHTWPNNGASIAHAAVSRNGQWQDLGTLTGDPDSYGFGINGDGHCVGYSRKTISGTEVRDRAFLFAGEAIAEVNELPTDSMAWSINDAGQIAGSRNPPADVYWDPWRAFLFDPRSGVIDVHAALLAHLGLPDVDSRATALNESGTVVGIYWGSTGWIGFFYDGTARELQGTGWVMNAALDVNDSGLVVGGGFIQGAWPGESYPTQHAVSYDSATEQVRDLGTLGGASSLAFDVNSAGHVVGAADIALPDDGWSRAFLYRDGRMVDLNTLIPPDSGWVLYEATGINDAGQIVGSGDQGYFLLTPITNQPPTVTLGGPLDVDEGGSLILTATATDPENEALTYEWDLDGDGTYETPSPDGSATFSAASLDGPHTRTVGVRVTDPGGLEAAATATVNILNVRPTATFAISPSTVYVGEAATVSFTGPSDPGVADTAAGFSYAYDCTSDGSFEVQASTTPSHSCAYTLAGGQSARGRIEDKGGSAAGGAPAVTAPG